MKTLYVDLETFSTADIKSGVYAYSDSPDFEILMAAYAVDDAPVQLLVGEDAIREQLLPLLSVIPRLVAHNAQFERVCLSVMGGTPLPPEPWDDTMARAAQWGYPLSLGKLAVALGAEEKDEAGTRLINLFCKPYRGKRLRAADRPEDWKAFCAYCIQDVATLRDIDRRLPGHAEGERAVWNVDQRINDRGIVVDRRMLWAAMNATRANAHMHGEALCATTGIENPNSLPQLKAWLATEGVFPSDLRADTITELLSSPLQPSVRRALELRQELSLVAQKKFGAAQVGLSADGRLRGQFRYMGAHTGRWSGRGVQLQNLPRAQLLEADEALAIEDLKLGEGLPPYELKALVRAMFVGPFAVCDYSAIEARVIAWLAGETWALDAFRKGRDIYVETAIRMGMMTQTDIKGSAAYTAGRYKGKIAVLALGYQGALNSLRALGAAAESDSELWEIVQAWRTANSNIVDLWYDLEDVFHRGGAVGDYLTVVADGNDRLLQLPSGRALCYRGYKSVMKRRPGQREAHPTHTFLDPRRGIRVDTYGGRLAENATQAVARDLLAHALVSMEAEGLPVVAHVHDEVLVETTDLASVQAAMCRTPGWATDLPVDAEGFVTERYRKG